MLPGIAQVHIVADCDHQPALVVVNPSPAWFKPIVFPDLMGLEKLGAGNLVAVIEIENGVKYRVAAIQVHYLPVGEHPRHGMHKDCPLPGSVKIVAHEETTPQQILAHLCTLLVG